MGANIRQHMATLQDKLDCIKTHPMCGKFEETATHYIVYYPLGDFEVDGVQCHKGSNKSAALEKMTEAMERHWLNSFPKRGE